MADLKAGLFPVEVKEMMLELSAGQCQHTLDCHLPATEFHHMLSNTQVNRKKFPLFVKSIFNCCPINHACHMTKTVPRIDERHAEKFEWYLQAIKAGKL